MTDEPRGPGSNPITPQDHVVFTELDGTEGVLVDLKAKSFYRLNETAMMVWQGLSQGKTIEEIAKEVTIRYDVPADRAAASIERLVSSFRTYRLVR